MTFEDFNLIIKDCKKKFDEKFPLKGESYKNMTPGELSIMMFKEMDEFTQSKNEQDAYQECLDIINLALMTAFQLNKSKRKKNK